MTKGNNLEDLAPDELLDMLVLAHGVESAEHLAGRSAISLRTLRRWQAEGYPVWWGKSVQLIRELGLLRPVASDDNGGDDHLPDLAEAVLVLVQGHEQQLAHLREVQQRLAAVEAELPRPSARPKRSARS